MKTRRLQSLLLFVLAALFTFSACKKDEDDDHDQGDNTNQPPVCLIIAPQNGDEFLRGDTILIQVNASDPEGALEEIRFYIDGIGKGAVSAPPFEFLWDTKSDSLGNHTLSAMSIDNLGVKSTDEIDIMLTDGSPKAEFTADSLFGEPPLQVQFTDQSSNNPTAFYWDFGDGNTSTAQNPLHIYNDVGVYNVLLIVSNAYASDSLVKYAYIVVSESPNGSFTDVRDGQTYATIEIGTQVWFAENLNFQTANSVWYDNDQQNGEIYGSLYTWDDATIACPVGWHLPSNQEYKILEEFLGMDQIELEGIGWRGTDQGAQMKATFGWDNEGNGSNTSGFTVLPAGYQDIDDSFYNEGISAFFWTATSNSSTEAWRRNLREDMDMINNGPNLKVRKFSARCLKD